MSKKMKIGVDFGHGGNTFPPSKGVYRNGVGYHEHDANVRVGLKLEAKLKAYGHTIVRGQEPYKNDVPLTTRTNKYFAEKVDLIVSLHANYNSNKSANGYASFYWHNDKEAKKFSDIYAEEIKKQGFKLWGGSRPSKPNDWSNFHMCRVPSQKGIPSILVENGFMGNDNDFEWIFGSKKEEYAERCATAVFNTIQRYLGNTISKPSNTNNSNSKVVYRVRKSWEDSKSQIGAYEVLQNAKDLVDKNKDYKVFDDKGKVVYEVVKKVSNPATSPKSSTLYRVRKSWADAKSQIGAYSILKNAKDLADNNKGYKVFDDSGKVVYTPKSNSSNVSNTTSKPASSSVSKPSIKKGSKGTYVREAQTKLINKGYNVGKSGADGDFGDLTDKAVRQLQKDAKLKVDGIVGKDTWNVLDGNFKKPTPKTQKEYVVLPASAKTWATYKLNVQPVIKNSDWSLSPSKFGGLTYEILGKPYPHVVTINTSKGKRNIYVHPTNTGAKIIKK